MKKSTEENSKYTNLQDMSILELIQNINKEDQTVSTVIKTILPTIERLIHEVVKQLEKGGRLFYIGAGTSGRLGILDASECPPTFGVSNEKVIGIIAGGDQAIRKAVENAEDSTTQGWKDLKTHHVNTKDVVIGIAASGTTPYVVSTIEKCNLEGITTGCITCNENSPLVRLSKFPIAAIVGPEFVTGSTRMKAGTAQKLILNMISTSAMIKLGHVQGNKMVDMQLSNDKLVDRGTKMIIEATGMDYKTAHKLLLEYGSVRKAIESLK